MAARIRPDLHLGTLWHGGPERFYGAPYSIIAFVENSGTARFASPVNVLDFVKIMSIIQLDDASCEKLSPVAVRLARAEQLEAHANAAAQRST